MGFLQQNRNAIIRDGWSRVEITAVSIDNTLIFLSAQLVIENQVLQSVERRHENMGCNSFFARQPCTGIQLTGPKPWHQHVSFLDKCKSELVHTLVFLYFKYVMH